MCSVRGGAIVGFWICADLGRGRHCTALPKWRCNAKCAEGSEVHTHVLPSPVDFENMYMSLPDVVAHTTCVTCVVNGLLRLSLWQGSSRFATVHVLKILYHELVKALRLCPLYPSWNSVFLSQQISFGRLISRRNHQPNSYQNSDSQASVCIQFILLQMVSMASRYSTQQGHCSGI
jgi:hypothetical protein